MKQEAIEVIRTRRSCRKYKDQPIDRQTLEAVLEAGTYAPTGKNTQCAFIVAVENPEDRKAVSRLNAAFTQNPNGEPYHGAPAVLIVFGPDTNLGVLDGAAVTMNMANAAHAVGLATCWVNRSQDVFDTEEGKALMKKWGLDPELRGIASLAIGYADGELPRPRDRKEGYFRVV